MCNVNKENYFCTRRQRNGYQQGIQSILRIAFKSMLQMLKNYRSTPAWMIVWWYKIARLPTFALCIVGMRERNSSNTTVLTQRY